MREMRLDPQTLETEGQHLFAQARYKEAAERFALAQRAYAEAGVEPKGAEMLNNVGVACRRAHQHHEAASALEQARETFARLGDQSREAQTLGNLGGLYSKMKRYDEAEACFKRAVVLFGQFDDRARQAETLRAMAVMQFKRGQRSRALTTYEEALFFLPNPNLPQRLLRFLLKTRSWLLKPSPFR